MKKIKIEKLHLEPFVDLIDSIGKVDKFISLRVDSVNVKSSVYFPEKDAVKAISLPVDGFFEFKTELDRNIKMCFYNGEPVNSNLNKFNGPGIISAEISVKEAENDSGELYATSLTVYNEHLKIEIGCADPDTGFIELTPGQLDAVFDTSKCTLSFDLDASQKTKFEDLMRIDPEKKVFSITAKDTGVYLSGSSYDYQVTEKAPGTSEKQHLFKKFFGVLDKDDYKVSVSEDRTFFESQQKDVKIVFSNAEE
jgi:hypothetical protein